MNSDRIARMTTDEKITNKYKTVIKLIRNENMTRDEAFREETLFEELISLRVG